MTMNNLQLPKEQKAEDNSTKSNGLLSRGTKPQAKKQMSNEEIDSEKIDQLLSAFIGNKLIEKEYNNFLVAQSLSQYLSLQHSHPSIVLKLNLLV